MNNTSKALSTIVLSALITGCSMQSLNKQPTSDNLVDNTPKQTDDQFPLADPEIEYAEFDAETMYALLTAEIAAQRGRYDITLLNYVQQARDTKDLAIIQRAFRIAQFLKASNAQLQLSKTWAEVEPNDIEANQLAAFHHARNKKYEEAMVYMERIIELGGDADLDRLAAHSKTLTHEEQQTLLNLYTALYQRHPENKEVIYSLAVMQKNTEHTGEAITTLAPLLKKDPEFQPAVLLQAGLLYDQGKLDEATQYLKEQTVIFPENRKMGTLYGRLLIDSKQLDEAQSVFKDLMERFPEAAGLRLSYALVSLENKDEDEAIEQFNLLLDAQQHTNESHFYLGRIADSKKDTGNAIHHYLNVESGTHFYSSISRASFLLAQEGRLNDALMGLEKLRQAAPDQAENFWLIEVNLLLDINEDDLALGSINIALMDFPKNSKLLYSRSMLLDKANRLEEMEADLRTILAAEPNNAVALNALGYTLADKTSRLMEAFDLISKAHELNPNNPAILDSMGWVYYKMGNLEKSLEYLTLAYSQFPDPEVAAHLGEVLWQKGNKDEALKLWQESLKGKSTNTIVQDTMQKLGVTFTDEPTTQQP
ncbi:tetratricopeptide repeat protein [Alkalimarinus alittae]|uniref:Tetratricopeptide repeat protein n=1 Tax=Alkalimarinus alittae TaxID=2961619 RepID=A0ABY6N4E5_9ALTE|nr:tetratricopeptide repeat protein [Alkalimarinus alittae]UZE96959.1 tetratricopeptide repeat protein [Alkalimarinus alittae]